MTDENTSEVVPETVTEENVAPEVTYTEIEQAAIAKGWKPKSEFKGDESDWKGANAFLKESARFESLIALQAETKKLKEMVAKQTETYKQLMEKSHEKEIAELKHLQASAAEVGDKDAVTKISDKLVELEKTRVKEEVVPKTQSTVQSNFIEKHPWYLNPKTPEDHHKIQLAREIDSEVSSTYPDFSIDAKLALISERLDARLHSQSVTKKVSSPIIPTSDHAIQTTKSEVDFNKLSDFDKNMIRYIKSVNPKFNDADLTAYVKSIGK